MPKCAASLRNYGCDIGRSDKRYLIRVVNSPNAFRSRAPIETRRAVWWKRAISTDSERDRLRPLANIQRGRMESAHPQRRQ